MGIGKHMVSITQNTYVVVLGKEPLGRVANREDDFHVWQQPFDLGGCVGVLVHVEVAG